MVGSKCRDFKNREVSNVNYAPTDQIQSPKFTWYLSASNRA